MSYVAALVYDPDGNFRGYTTLNHEANKLKSTNLWSEAELPKLNEQLGRLNGNESLQAHWPRTDDPEVAALLNNAQWEPLEMELADIVDDDASHWVWTYIPQIDLATGQAVIDPQTGQPRMVKGELDRQSSVIRYKQQWVPKEPIKAQVRTKKAQELIARKRAGL